MSSAHKPRRKNLAGVAGATAVVKAAPGNSAEAASFTLAQLLRPGRRTTQWVLVPIILMIAALFRWAVGLWGYSGQGIAPMYGDFEAQRHWMEITTHLPAAWWYFYDLEYWGLDYPPLTAYHSWLLGRLGSLLNPAWFALDSSRGLEAAGLKVYMRASVLVSEYLVYVPAAVVLFRRYAAARGGGRLDASLALSAFLLQPGTMLVDHGHFQYNTVMLGFVLAAVAAFVAGRAALGCACFVAALAFKQMALYYAPAVFAYLVGACLFPRIDVLLFLRIAVATALAFAAAFAPLLAGAWWAHARDPNLVRSLEPPFLLRSLAELIPPGAVPLLSDETSPLYVPALHLTQAVHRIFPLARGLFEDKVANFWCALHTAYKLSGFPVSLLSRLSLAATLVAIAPACLAILLAPPRRRAALLPLALAACAWGFFLFSFQVHEKSVLLPLLPMTLLLGTGSAAGDDDDGHGHGVSVNTRAWVGFANTIGAWTMFPLLRRDGLVVPYAVLTLLWAYLLDLPPVDWSLFRPDLGGSSSSSSSPSSSSSSSTSDPAAGSTTTTTSSSSSPSSASSGSVNKQAHPVTAAAQVPVYVLAVLWHACDAAVAPPPHKPDLWPLLNALVGFAAFAMCYLWCTGQLLYRCGALDWAFRWLDAEVARNEDRARAAIAARKSSSGNKNNSGNSGNNNNNSARAGVGATGGSAATPKKHKG